MNTYLKITVGKARASNVDSPSSWTFLETHEGWLAMCGDATLFSMNSRKPRVFKSLDCAINRLRAEVGVFSFTVEAAPLVCS